MSVKRRITALSVFLVFLILFTILFTQYEKKLFCGAFILSEQSYFELVDNRLDITESISINNIIRFNGKKIPYDSINNTFYVIQNDEKDFIGIFSSNDSKYQLGFLEEDMNFDKTRIISSGTPVELLVYSENEYAKCKVVFTTLPVVNLTTEKYESEDEQTVDINIWDPYSKGVLSLSDYSVGGKINRNEKGTYTIKFVGDEKEYLDISILGFSENHTYKLYEISKNDVFSEVLSYDLWNHLSLTELHKKDFDFCELIVDDQYKGLYIISSKLNNSMLKNESISIVEGEDTEGNVGYINEKCNNTIEYLTFLQLVEAFDNTDEDYLKIVDSNENFDVVPGRIRYSLGNNPNRFLYMGYKKEAADLFSLSMWDDTTSENLKTEISKLWNDVYSVKLNDNAIDELIDYRTEELQKSGLFNRLAPDDGQVNIEEQAKALGEYVNNRITFLNGLYGEEVKYASNTDKEMFQGEYRGYCDIGFVDSVSGKKLKLFIDHKNSYMFLPSYFDEGSSIIEFDDNKYRIALNDSLIENGQSAAELISNEEGILKIAFMDGAESTLNEMELAFTVMKSENLPAIFIDTANGTMNYLIRSKENKEPGKFCCITTDGKIDSETKIRNIHGRGETSWYREQKGYKINLSQEENILNMGEGDSWNLVSNSYDATRVRNALAYSLAEDLGLSCAVEYRFVDVYFNGEYSGNYIICEPANADGNRLGITSGSVILERTQEGRLEEDATYFVTGYSHCYEIANPDEFGEEMISLVEKVMSKIEKIIDSCSATDDLEDIGSMVDIDSLAKQYLITMLTNEKDSNRLSTFYYLSSEDGKLYAGPEWDFDRCWGALSPYDQIGDYNLNAYGAGLSENLIDNEQFFLLVREMFLQNKDAIYGLPKRAEEYLDLIEKSYDMSFVRYGYFTDKLVNKETQSDNIDYLIDNIEGRIWLTEDYLLNPDTYHRVYLGGKSGMIYYVKDGNCMPKAVVDYLLSTMPLEKATTTDGKEIKEDLPVGEDMVVDIYFASETE